MAVTPAGQEMLGGVSSTTVTVNEQLGPAVVHVTMVEPTTNTEPDGGEQVTAPQPLAVGE